MTTADVFDASRFTPGNKIVTYLRLGKARIYHHAHGWILALLLLQMDGLLTGRTVLAMALSLVMLLAIQWSAAASDDIGGYRDGVDAQNYAGRPYRTVVKKPLITGALTEREAVRFAVGAWLTGVAAGVATALTMEGETPPLAVALLLLAQVCAVQYSIGIKLSYRPLGLEFVILYTIGCTALMPYWFVAGSLNGEILLTSAMMGTWFLLVVSYGNASDREGDAAVSRRTLAVLLPPAWFSAALHFFFACSVALLTLMFTVTRFESWLFVFVIPVIAMQAAQLYYGAYRKELRKARFMGLLSLDAGFVGLAIAFLLS
jgi:1,4-dihydroxy-2-naphthoate octaprenyltransferase